VVRTLLSGAELVSVFVAVVYWGSSLPAQARVAPVFATRAFAGSNVDSCAVWVAPPGGTSLLFVTEKDGDRVEVFDASTGAQYKPRPFLGGKANGSGPDDFNRPNGVWVLYHVPVSGGFADVLLVTDQENLRVKVLRLPELSYFGELGSGQVGRGYGIAWYQDGRDTFVYITDQEPPAAFPGKIKKYRLRPQGAGLGADLVAATGSATGTPPLPRVESILADPFHDRLHLCGDEGGDRVRLFRLDGTYTGTDYGEPQFEYDQEGINLYATGPGAGYLVISDQYRNGSPNQFEVFDRASLAPLGNFQSPSTAKLITRNTDGAYLEQRPLPGFPNGAFYAVNDDVNCHAYDWTDVAQAMGLELVALDRPFPSRAPAASGAAAARPLLWFHDASWWGALTGPSGLMVARLEDGTFAPQGSLTGGLALGAAAALDTVVVLTSAAPDGSGTLSVQGLSYRAAQRRYEALGSPAVLPGASGPLADVVLESSEAGKTQRAWAAWVAGSEVRATWSDAMLGAWDAAGVSLGTARAVAPCLVRLPAATALVWEEDERVVLRLHADGDSPERWSSAAEAAAVPASASSSELASAAAADGTLLLALADPASGLRLRKRSPAGSWSEAAPLAGASSPLLVADERHDTLHLFFVRLAGGRRLLHYRPVRLGDLAYSAERFFVGWPGVDLGELAPPRTLPGTASDLAVAAVGSDGLGYFGRVALSGVAPPGNEDLTAPVTLQHSPPPGAEGVREGSSVAFRITDDRAGVDRASLRVLVNGRLLTPSVRGVPRNYLVSFPLPAGSGPRVQVRIEASDLAVPSPKAMTPFEYELTTAGKKLGLFRRGDANDDGVLDVSDAVRTLLALFVDAGLVLCAGAADANDDGLLDLSDAIALLEFLFRGGARLPAPMPECGADPTPDDLVCEVGVSCR
jgi:3-phytase